MTSPSPAMQKPAFEVINPSGKSPVVLVCEHASNYFPLALHRLGISEDAAESHIAWDPGALQVAMRLWETLDAKLVATTHSRLIYDCNRPPESPGAMPILSERYVIPGNEDLSEKDKKSCVDCYYLPYNYVLKTTLSKKTDPILVTIHSFTPVYNGENRDTDVGILHDIDTRLADAMLQCAGTHTDMLVRRNDPYGPEDGVTHTLKTHGIADERPNVMIEIRNDLIRTPLAQTAVADMIGRWLADAIQKSSLSRDVAWSV